jgi:hypothetical protein
VVLETLSINDAIQLQKSTNMNIEAFITEVANKMKF